VKPLTTDGDEVDHQAQTKHAEGELEDAERSGEHDGVGMNSVLPAVARRCRDAADINETTATRTGGQLSTGTKHEASSRQKGRVQAEIGWQTRQLGVGH
jgi:hypothetical protein